jgi:predicted DCC family thiol-disulfide oxidoreductase YuxK
MAIAACATGPCSFIVRHDRDGTAFRFAPIQGQTFGAMVPAASRNALLKSMVVLTVEGRLLLKSDAWLHIMRRLGGMWKLLGGVCRVFPRVLRDWVYDLVAAVRFRSFGRRNDLCLVMSPALRSRFLP